MKRFLLLFFLAFLFSPSIKLVAQEIQIVKDTSNWQKFENAEQKYSIKIPPTWVVHFDNKMGDYIFHSSKDPKGIDNLSIEVNCKTVPKTYTLDKFFEDCKGAGKSRFKDYEYIDERLDQVNGVPTKWFSFLFNDGDIKKQAAQYCFTLNEKAYNITFSANMTIYNGHTEELTDILNTFDSLSYQPCATVTMDPPEKWFTSKDANSLFVFSAIDNDGKSLSDGVIKVMQRSLSKNHNTHEFLLKIKDEILAERPDVGFTGTAAIPDLNGQKFEWFDIVEKDSDFVERYYVTVYQRCGFIIYNIANKDKFEKELKFVIAGSLKTFKLDK